MSWNSSTMTSAEAQPARVAHVRVAREAGRARRAGGPRSRPPTRGASPPRTPPAKRSSSSCRRSRSRAASSSSAARSTALRAASYAAARAPAARERREVDDAAPARRPASTTRSASCGVRALVVGRAGSSSSERRRLRAEARRPRRRGSAARPARARARGRPSGASRRRPSASAAARRRRTSRAAAAAPGRRPRRTPCSARSNASPRSTDGARVVELAEARVEPDGERVRLQQPVAEAVDRRDPGTVELAGEVVAAPRARARRGCARAARRPPCACR